MSKIDEYKDLLLQKKEKGLEDLFYFNKYILESDDKRRELLVPHVHGEWVDWYKNSKSRIKMILVPRACFKSTFFTVGRTLQQICQNRDSRILIANATLANSQKFLGEVKDHLIKNETLRLLYGEMYDKDLKWNESEIEVLGRSVGVREPTVTAAGVGGNLVSQHYNLIIADDLVNLENSNTRYLADKVIDWWKRAFSLLDYDGEMIIIGTRWSYYELYSWVLEKFGEKIDYYIRGAYNEDGSMYFPELLSEDKLDELRALQGSYVFSAFYLNDPVDEDSALLKRDQIKYWGPGEEADIPKFLNIFAVCDPAVSQSAQADESSIIVVGIDPENNWYILETRSGRWTVGELIEELFSVYKQWKPITMTIEVIGQGQGIMHSIHSEEDKRNVYLPLVEINVRPQIKKEIRVRSVLQPRFERGKIYLKRDMYDLEEQLLKFPRHKRDDMVDALTDIEDIGFEAETPEKQFEESGSFLQDMLRRQFTEPTEHFDPYMGEYF